MRPHDHADDLSPDQRFQHVATLLATGLRRLQPRTISPAELGQPDGTKNPPELSPNGLELPGETRLSGHTG
jgi:hypothetical protein